MYRSFCMKLINFTLAHAVLMVVKLLESFLFTTCIPIVCGTYGGEERCLWSSWGNMKKTDLRCTSQSETIWSVDWIGLFQDRTGAWLM